MSFLSRTDALNLRHFFWHGEVNMVLYYLLLRIWIHLGVSEFVIRLFSVCAAVATIRILYLIACDYSDVPQALSPHSCWLYTGPHRLRTTGELVFIGRIAGMPVMLVVSADAGGTHRGKIVLAIYFCRCLPCVVTSSVSWS